MKPTRNRWGALTLRALSMWAAFTLFYAAITYFTIDRGRPFRDLLVTAAIGGVLFFVFYGLIARYLARRRQRAQDPSNDPHS